MIVFTRTQLADVKQIEDDFNAGIDGLGE